ncbi:DNA polymerase III subunit alpha [Jeotgalibacillus proteolyticus]|uniref:DNA polymerase III subunit alpha n=1 Tax=Jeotgalibacillus proteolyticus TaxID=2082395 RepID=A0A2S5GF10_9BACL|nr:DNA polymerase III subunit alpha [Jeotgalibacillus proteolyticus]PPA71627.1 DNA polymerase III subunit alpha [Jeotgalibacillus proteolyticus]
MSYIHLQITSSFDLLSSPVTLSALVDKVKKDGSPAVALTDRNVLYGVVPFYRACVKENIKPIIGMTADVLAEEDDRPYPLVLLAKNQTGYKNLIKISSVLMTNPSKGISRKWLSSYSDGLIALTPGSEGEIEQLIQNDENDLAHKRILLYQKIFREDSFYLSLQDHNNSSGKELLKKLAHFAESFDLQTAVTGDVRYLEEEDAFSYEVITAIRDGIKLESPRLEGDYSFRSKESMKELFADFPDALENTLKIADRCNLTLDFTQLSLPEFPVPDDVTAKEVLEHLCLEGLKRKMDPVPSAYTERLAFELNVIDSMSFNDYFLIVWDFMKFARDKKILTGPGRGSAAGSLVAYALSITQVDPLKYNLLFERFLNPERISMPDIDIDFPDNRRDEVIHYVAQKYGSKHVAQIVTFGTLSAKASARDTARVFGFSTGEMEVISRSIPSRVGIKLEEAYRESGALRQFADQSSRHKQWFESAKKLEGLPRHTSTHAAGVVISSRPLVEIVPLQDGQEGVYLTQWPMDLLEDIGLLKMDFLGLRNLTLLERIIHSVNQKEGARFRIEDIPVDDKKTFELLSRGWTVGIFQLESDGMKNVLRTLLPTSFDDIVAVNALYRPGPMENIPVFIKRKHKKEAVSYAHPDLKSILSSTHGIIVYQEQIMQIAAQMAGFSLGQADVLRRAVSKKKKEELDFHRKSFVEGSVKRGYEERTAHEIYDLIVRFANYGFNKSHAVAYSLIGYQLAYLKTHFPKHFMAALMTSVTGNEDKLRLYVRECERLNIKVFPPSIQKSERYFAVEQEGIRYSISAIKGIGKATAIDLIQSRESKPYKDIFDLCVRVPAKSINRKILEALVFSGAMDDFSKDRSTLLATLDVALEHASLMKSEDGGLFDDDFSISPKYVEKSPMPAEEKLSFEKEVLGLYLSAHPVTAIQEKLETLRAVPIAELSSGTAVFGALITEVRMIRTKKGEAMAFAVLSDASGDIDAVAFPDTYRHASAILKQGFVVIVKGKAEERNGKLQVILQEVKLAKDFKADESNHKLFIKVPSSLEEEDTISKIRELCSRYKGDAPVVIHIEETRRTLQLQASEWVYLHGPLPAQLKNLVGESNVVIK